MGVFIVVLIIGGICIYAYRRMKEDAGPQTMWTAEDIVDLHEREKKVEKENVKSDHNHKEEKNMEEKKGTRDLFLEILTKIGCQYEIDEEDGRILFAFQGENFTADASNDRLYVRVWDPFWGSVELYDVDEFARLRKAINSANLSCATTTVFTVNEEGSTVDVHSKSIFLFIPQIPELENYLRNELSDFFIAHRLVGTEMAKLREKEEAKQ